MDAFISKLKILYEKVVVIGDKAAMVQSGNKLMIVFRDTAVRTKIISDTKKINKIGKIVSTAYYQTEDRFARYNNFIDEHGNDAGTVRLDNFTYVEEISETVGQIRGHRLDVGSDCSLIGKGGVYLSPISYDIRHTEELDSGDILLEARINYFFNYKALENINGIKLLPRINMRFSRDGELLTPIAQAEIIGYERNKGGPLLNVYTGETIKLNSDVSGDTPISRCKYIKLAMVIGGKEENDRYNLIYKHSKDSNELKLGKTNDGFNWEYEYRKV